MSRVLLDLVVLLLLAVAITYLIKWGHRLFFPDRRPRRCTICGSNGVVTNISPLAKHCPRCGDVLFSRLDSKGK